jgi:hypothetical protein
MSAHGTPLSAATLADRIIAVVTDRPGISTIALCRELRVRKADVLVELAALRREHRLGYEPGHRGAKSWFVLSEPPSCSHTCSRGTSAAREPASEHEKVTEIEGAP